MVDIGPQIQSIKRTIPMTLLLGLVAQAVILTWTASKTYSQIETNSGLISSNARSLSKITAYISTDNRRADGLISTVWAHGEELDKQGITMRTLQGYSNSRDVTLARIEESIKGLSAQMDNATSRRFK